MYNQLPVGYLNICAVDVTASIFDGHVIQLSDRLMYPPSIKMPLQPPAVCDCAVSVIGSLTVPTALIDLGHKANRPR